MYKKEKKKLKRAPRVWVKTISNGVVFYFLKQLDFKYNESYHVHTKYKGDTIMENNKTNNSLTGYKGLTYTQEAKGADAKTK